MPAVTSLSLSFQERHRCVLESNPACFFLSIERDNFLSQMLFSLEKGCETLALKTEVQCQPKKKQQTHLFLQFSSRTLFEESLVNILARQLIFALVQ